MPASRVGGASRSARSFSPHWWRTSMSDRAPQRLQRARHRGVERARALAAAEHEQAQARRRARNANARRRRQAAISSRTGLPTVSSITPRERLRETGQHARAKRASTRLVKPGARFCSCTSSGTPAQPRRCRPARPRNRRS
jgi:hypothetical protein